MNGNSPKLIGQDEQEKKIILAFTYLFWKLEIQRYQRLENHCYETAYLPVSLSA